MTSPVGIVFGGSHGIGAATARMLAEYGVSVAVAARNESSCYVVADKIMTIGGKAMAMSCDVTDSRQVTAAITATIEQFGRVDYVINSAGVMDPIGLIEEVDPGAWRQCLDANLNGSFHGCHAALPVLRAQGSGVIVNMSSGAAFHALKGWGAYCVAKAGLAMLTQMLAVELADTDIRIYGFQPGMVNTGLTREALQHKVNRVANLDYTTFDPPEAPAAAIAWLCRHRPRDLSGSEVMFTDSAFRKRIKAGDSALSTEYVS